MCEETHASIAEPTVSVDTDMEGKVEVKKESHMELANALDLRVENRVKASSQEVLPPRRSSRISNREFGRKVSRDGPSKLGPAKIR